MRTAIAAVAVMATRKSESEARKPAQILAVDIGGSKVKFLATGETEARKIVSGPQLSPARMVDEVRRAARDWKFSAVSIGYPGQVGNNGPTSEPGNLGHGWVGFDFAAAFECPVRVVNDAAMQALGSYDGGRMLFIGFGTGVGSVLIVHHTIIPLELGELAYKPGHTLSTRFGRAALDRQGKKKWRQRVLEVLPTLQRAFLADYVVIGGGNSKHVREPLPPNVRRGHNLTAFRGGYRLWGIDDMPTFGVNGDDHFRPLADSDWRLL